MSGNCIDLTEDVDEVVQPAKRQRLQASESLTFLDCEIISDGEDEAEASVQGAEEAIGDITITGTSGQVGC